jgi:hypothetical protein
MINKQNFGYYFSMGSLFLIFVFLLLFGYLCFVDGYNAVVTPDKLMTAYYDSEKVFVEVEQCKNTDKPATVYVSFVNALVFNVPPESVAGMPKGCSKVNKQVVVPKDLPEGTYNLVVKRCYKINFLKDFCNTYETEKFEIRR